MTKRRGEGGGTLAHLLLPGQRETLERELLWAIALGGNRKRIEQLERMLTPAANDAFEARLLAGSAPDDSADPGK